MNSIPQFIMLVGLPGSGKTTYRKANFSLEDYVVLSTDDIIEEIARLRNLTYSSVFSGAIKEAGDMVDMTFKSSLENNFNIVLDQTSVSRSSRKKKLSKVPKHYHKKAIVFVKNEKDIDKINIERIQNGRSIPPLIFEHMKINFNFSGIEREGFNEVVFVGLENGKTYS